MNNKSNKIVDLFLMNKYFIMMNNLYDWLWADIIVCKMLINMIEYVFIQSVFLQ